MRVLMVSKACIVGSYQTKLEALARMPDVELSVLVPPSWKVPGGSIPLERLHLNGYRLIVTPIRFNGHFHLHYYPELGRWMQRLKPHIMHVDEEPYNLATYLGLKAGKSQGAGTLFFSWQNLYRPYPLPFRWIEKACYQMADYAIAGNADAREVLQRKGYDGPMAVIPQFGIDPGRYQGLREASAGSRQVFRVGFAGRLVPEKGVHVLLQALAGLTGSWEVMIAGQGPSEKTLRELAEQWGIAGRVRFCGQIPSAEMPAFFSSLDVFVLPSVSRPNWIEQFGRVLIEAMASEAAVIGSSCGEIPRVIDDAGLIFPEGEANALRDRLQRLYDDRELCGRLARAGRQRALARYTQESIAQQTYQVYQALLSDASSTECPVV